MRLALYAAIVAIGFIWFRGSRRRTPGSPASASRSDVRSRRWTGRLPVRVTVAADREAGRLRAPRLMGTRVDAQPCLEVPHTIGAVPHSRTLGLLLLWLALGLAALEGLLFGLALSTGMSTPSVGAGSSGLAESSSWSTVADVDHLERMASIDAAFGRALVRLGPCASSQPHRRLVVMAIGAVVVVYVLVAVAVDLVRAFPGQLPSRATGSNSPGSRNKRNSHTARPRSRSRRCSWRSSGPCTWPGHPVDTHDPGRDLCAALHGPQRGRRLRRPARPRLHRILGDRVVHDGVLHWRVAIQPPFILNPFWIIPSPSWRDADRVLIGTPTLRLRGDYLAIVTWDSGDHRDRREQSPWGDRRTGGDPGVIPQFSVHLLG